MSNHGGKTDHRRVLHRGGDILELPNVRVHGKIEDVAPAMQHSSVICLPTMMREGVPMSLIEGAASGKPLLTTDLPGCRETVVDGLNGYLVPEIGRASCRESV